MCELGETRVSRSTVTGFTLIELVVTMAVAAILLAMAVPSFNSFYDRARLRGAADDVVSLISTARGEAVKTGRDVSIAVGGTTDAWCVGANEAATPAVAGAFQASAACDCTSTAACSVDDIRRVVAATDYRGVGVATVGTSFQIDGKLGSLVNITAAPAVTMISPSGNYELQLEVSPLGQTRACVPSGKLAVSGYPAC